MILTLSISLVLKITLYKNYVKSCDRGFCFHHNILQQRVYACETNIHVELMLKIKQKIIELLLKGLL